MPKVLLLAIFVAGTHRRWTLPGYFHRLSSDPIESEAEAYRLKAVGLNPAPGTKIRTMQSPVHECATLRPVNGGT